MNGLSNESVVVHSNSDWVQDLESHKSVTGYFTLMAYRIISWVSCQQKLVALSLTKAKYIVFYNCGC